MYVDEAGLNLSTSDYDERTRQEKEELGKVQKLILTADVCMQVLVCSLAFSGHTW